MMKQKKSVTAYWKVAVWAAFAVASFLYWCYVSPSLLSDREQTVLFLYNGDYFMQRIVVPGGLARYLGDFLTQFFCKPNTGACAFALLLLLVQWFSLVILRRHGMGRTFPTFLISFLPSVVLWFMATRPSVTMTLVVAVALVIAVMALMPRKMVPSLVYSALMVPLCYWLAGPSTWLFVAYALFCWLRLMSSRLRALAYGAALSVLMLFCIIGSSYFVSYPTSRLMSGIDYYYSEPYTPHFLHIMEVSDNMLVNGYVNSSQRNAFEAMELIPNYNKSARVLIRLIDTSVITEQYELALKYISILDETLFYRKKARQMRRFAENPQLIKGTNFEKLNNHYKTTKDEFFM